MPRILIKGYANDEHYDETPCLCLDLIPERAKLWLERVALVKKLKEADREVYSLDYWEYAGDFFDLYSLESTDDALRDEVDTLIEALEREEMVVLEPGTPLYAHVEGKLNDTTFDGGALIRTETGMLEVTEDAVNRCAYVKHTGIRVESTRIMVDDLGKFAGGLTVTPGKDA